MIVTIIALSCGNHSPTIDCAEEEMENVAMIITPECTALLFGPGPLSHFYSGQLLAFSLHGNYQLTIVSYEIAKLFSLAIAAILAIIWKPFFWRIWDAI